MTPPRNTRGLILLPVVLMIAVLAAVAFTLNQSGSAGVRATYTDHSASKAEQIANAGLQHALWQINQAGCGPYSDIAATSLGDGNYETHVSTNNVGGSVTTTNVAVSADAYIKKNSSSQNFGSTVELETYASTYQTDIRRSLYRFDIASAGIAPGTTIVSGIMKLYVTNSNASASVRVHQVTADWVENTVNWNNIHADHESSSIGSIPRDSPSGAYAKVNITPLVQGWVNGTIANQGVILKTATINDLARFSSKEYWNAAKRPMLEIKVASGGYATTASVSAKGSLADGATRTIVRDDISLYQPATEFIWQPGAGIADSTIRSGSSTRNYGATTTISISGNGDHNGLVKFNLDTFPSGVRVNSARLGLYLESGASLVDGVLNLYRLTQSWVEGIEDDVAPFAGDGVTYNKFDGSTNWNTAGGDYEPVALDSIIVPSLTEGWYEWDITEAVQQQLAGQQDHGYLLRGNGGTVDNVLFTSADSATIEQHPRIILDIACACGETCLFPLTTGKILMLVGDAANLAESDEFKSKLFEHWGYTVALLDDDANNGQYNADLSANDVVYVSETVNSTTVGSQLTSTAIGIVNEEGWLNDELGFESSNSSESSAITELDVTDTGHYITQQLPSGLVPIYARPMKGLVTSGATAGGLQSLANINANTSLAVLASGATTASGGAAAGRRVMLPVGTDDNINWKYVNGNGRSLVQRALQWAGRASNCTEYSIARQIFNGNDDAEEYESNGYMYLHSTDIEFGYDQEAATNMLPGLRFRDIFIPAGSEIVSATIDFVIDETDSGATDIQFYGEASDNAPQFSDLQNISLRPTTIASVEWDNVEPWTAVDTVVTSPVITSIIQEIIDRPGWAEGNALAVLAHATGVRVARTYEDIPGHAAVLRVTFCTDQPVTGGLPTAHWKLDETSGAIAADSEGGYDGALTNGPVWTPAGLIDGALAFDEFDDYVRAPDFSYGPNFTVSFSFKVDNNSGGLFKYIFSHGDINGFNSLNIFLNEDSHGTDPNVMRTVIRDADDPLDNFALQFDIQDIIGDGNWHTYALTVASGVGAHVYLDGVQQGQSGHGGDAFNPATDLFFGARQDLNPERLYGGLLDNIQIHDRILDLLEMPSLSSGGSSSSSGGGSSSSSGGGSSSSSGGGGCNGTFRDEFNSSVFSGNDGSLTWAGDWLEIGESDGPSSGDIEVSSDQGDNRLQTRDNDNGGEGVQRELDLSGGASAVLSYRYRRNGLDSSGDYTSVEISSNGAAGPWTELVRHQGGGTDSIYQSANHNISSYIAANTTIRIKTSSSMGNNDYVWFDDIEIQCFP